MSHSTIGFAFEDLGEKEMAASQNASSSANSIVTIYSLTGTCLPSITVTICQVTVPVTITVTAAN
ncbi:hypothetical protein [Clostridium sp. BNL1100]|uniref:hypothetical protein n=1 Tax=Clostridium sp. BNL1100 TaxID=755731 RepID=UPI00024A785E|nr:hypothetical protein [Clostridium sp. BNL1100]AEY67394.1 hypothetical protein Clo1100_3248 [Clostridium sp. BNL1100]